SPYLCVSWSVPPPPSSTLFPYTTLFRSLLGLVGGPDRFLRAFVEVEVLRVDHDVHIRHAPQLAQLQRGELHLRRTTAAEDVHVGDRAGAQPLGHVVRDLRDHQVVHVLDQDPGHVQCHVARTEHGDLAGLQRPGAGHVRVPVVPGDEVRGAEAAVQVDTGDVQVGVPDRTGGEDHCVVVVAQVSHAQVGAVVHVPD